MSVCSVSKGSSRTNLATGTPNQGSNTSATSNATRYPSDIQKVVDDLSQQVSKVYHIVIDFTYLFIDKKKYSSFIEE